MEYISFFDKLEISIDTDNLELLPQFAKAVEDELKLIPAPSFRKRALKKAQEDFREEGRKPIPEILDDIEGRLTRLEQKTSADQLPLTCFLSFQFSGQSLEYGRQVKHFLELLDIKVITGQGYEPKPINEKVRERLSERLDIVIVIEVADRKSSWTRDEMARAQSPGVFLIPLVEEGTTFDRGIYGDHEYINFASGHVSDAFIGLLEGMKYVQRVRAATPFAHSVDTAVGEKVFAILSSSKSAFRMNSEKGSPSRVFIGPRPRHII